MAYKPNNELSILKYLIGQNLITETDDDGTYIYLGQASSGSATSDERWEIKRVTKASGAIRFAEGSSSFDKTWDDRLTYSYS
jgi:hypothetical protein